MKQTVPVFALVAACAACCAAPVLLPMLAGLMISGAGLTVFGWQAGIVALLATGVLGLAIIRRNRKHARALATAAVIGGSCGCPSIGPEANLRRPMCSR